MKNLVNFFLFIPLLIFGQTPNEEKGIHFEHTAFAELLAKAKNENKMVMVDAFTTWCGPCKWMAKNIFPNDTVAELYNKNFISAEIDMEKGEGIELAKKYQVMCYPTFLFIDNNGQLLHRMSGSMPAKNFVELGQNAMNPVKQFNIYKKKYDSGNITTDEIGDYVLMRGRSCLPVKEEIDKYFSTQKDADLTSKRNWEIFLVSNIDINSREFKYLVNHRADYEKLYDPKIINTKIESSYYGTLHNFIKQKNTDEYKKLKEEILKNNFPFSEEMVLKGDLDLYQSTKDWNNYAQAAVKYADKFAKDDFNTLNNISWSFYENISDKTMLAKAEEWMKHSVELNPGYFNYDTYAAVQYKLGKKSEARATAEKAIELAKKEGQDYKETQLLLDKIKELK